MHKALLSKIQSITKSFQLILYRLIKTIDRSHNVWSTLQLNPAKNHLLTLKRNRDQRKTEQTV